MRYLIILLAIGFLSGCAKYLSPYEMRTQAHQNCPYLGFKPPVEGRWDKSCTKKCYSEESDCREDNSNRYCAGISLECIQKCYAKEPEEKYEAREKTFNNCKLAEFQRLQNQEEQRRAAALKTYMANRPSQTNCTPTYGGGMSCTTY